MGRYYKTSVEELSPYVRKAGKQEQNSSIRNRKIYDHEFLYCLGGKSYMTIEDRKYDIQEDSLVLVKPDMHHSFIMDENNPAVMLWVHFDYIYREDVTSLDELLASRQSVLYSTKLPLEKFIRPEPVFENGYRFPELITVKQNLIMADIFKKIVSAYMGSVHLWQLECKILLLKIFELILQQTSKVKNIRSESNSSSIKLIKNYIKKNCYRKISVKELANVAGLSRDYTGKLFKRETGKTLTGYINEIRIQKAKELLYATDLSITNLAEIVGFSDVYYFSKVMKQYEGVSPANWRKHNL